MAPRDGRLTPHKSPVTPFEAFAPALTPEPDNPSVRLRGAIAAPFARKVRGGHPQGVQVCFSLLKLTCFGITESMKNPSRPPDDDRPFDGIVRDPSKPSRALLPPLGMTLNAEQRAFVVERYGEEVNPGLRNAATPSSFGVSGNRAIRHHRRGRLGWVKSGRNAFTPQRTVFRL